MIVGDGGLTDWNNKIRDDRRCLCATGSGEETPFASSEYSKTLFDESYNAKRRSYTVTNAEGFALGELDSGGCSPMLTTPSRTESEPIHRCCDRWRLSSGRGTTQARTT